MKRNQGEETPSTPSRLPDEIMQLEGTSIKVFGPGTLAETERRARHAEVVRNVAACLRTIGEF